MTKAAPGVGDRVRIVSRAVESPGRPGVVAIPEQTWAVGVVTAHHERDGWTMVELDEARSIGWDPAHLSWEPA